MSKKTLFSLIASILGVTGIAESSTSKLEVSIGGSPAEFPEGAKGFLIVDTAGDGFDFAKSPTILENKSESAVGSKWGDDDTVVMAGLPSVEFPGLGRGFNATPRDVESTSWKSGDKLAMVWFPEGSSAGGKPYSYYTSNQIESERGTNAFEIPEDGAVDSIVADGTPTAEGTVVSSPSVTPPKSADIPPQKAEKKGKDSKKTSASKSAKAKLKSESIIGSKKASASKSSGGKKSTAKKAKKK
jgi:hypothetical protein